MFHPSIRPLGRIAPPSRALPPASSLLNFCKSRALHGSFYYAYASAREARGASPMTSIRAWPTIRPGTAILEADATRDDRQTRTTISAHGERVVCV
eukprot:scaffold4212_cov122-Isochrysis_galbana.AAC.18